MPAWWGDAAGSTPGRSAFRLVQRNGTAGAGGARRAATVAGAPRPTSHCGAKSKGAMSRAVSRPLAPSWGMPCGSSRSAPQNASPRSLCTASSSAPLRSAAESKRGCSAAMRPRRGTAVRALWLVGGRGGTAGVVDSRARAGQAHRSRWRRARSVQVRAAPFLTRR